MARRAVTSVSYASSAAAAETNPLPFDKIERKAESMVKRYAELVAKVNGPDVSQSELRGMHEEIGQIQPIAEKLEALRGLRAERDGAAELAASDAEDEDIVIRLTSTDPQKCKNIVRFNHVTGTFEKVKLRLVIITRT